MVTSAPLDDAYAPFPSFDQWLSAPFDDAAVGRLEARLAEAKKASSPEQLDQAVRVATRYAAVDTNAIEGLYTTDRGFTKTIATQAAAWQAALTAKGPGVREAIDDALNAYDFVLDAVTEVLPVTEIWIRQIHELVCRSQENYTVHTAVGPREQPLPKGVYKTLPNSPTNVSTGRTHHYAPPDDTPAEMSRLIDELRTQAFREAHPVVQAAYAHNAYVCIHPFSDGNGRVARVLASVFLYRRPGLPVVVFADQRADYLDALEAADGGDPRPFVEFIEQRTIDAAGLILASIGADASRVAERLSSLASLRGEYAGPDLEDLAAVAARYLAQEVEAQMAALELPQGFSWDVSGSLLRVSPAPAGYRSVPNSSPLMLSLESQWPAAASVRVRLQPFSRATAQAEGDVALVAQVRVDSGAKTSDVHTHVLDAASRELSPMVSKLFTLKLSAWFQGVLGRAVEELAAEGQRSLDALNDGS